MRLVAFPVRYYQDEEGGWNAEFPGLEGCLTCADTLEELKANAVEALSGYLPEVDAKIALAAEATGGEELVTPELPVALALTIRKMRLLAGVNQKDAASRIGVSQAVWARWEDPDQGNATAATIEKVARAFGRRVEMSFPEAS